MESKADKHYYSLFVSHAVAELPQKTTSFRTYPLSIYPLKFSETIPPIGFSQNTERRSNFSNFNKLSASLSTQEQGSLNISILLSHIEQKIHQIEEESRWREVGKNEEYEMGATYVEQFLEEENAVVVSYLKQVAQTNESIKVTASGRKRSEQSISKKVDKIARKWYRQCFQKEKVPFDLPVRVCEAIENIKWSKKYLNGERRVKRREQNEIVRLRIWKSYIENIDFVNAQLQRLESLRAEYTGLEVSAAKNRVHLFSQVSLKRLLQLRVEIADLEEYVNSHVPKELLSKQIPKDKLIRNLIVFAQSKLGKNQRQEGKDSKSKIASFLSIRSAQKLVAIGILASTLGIGVLSAHTDIAQELYMATRQEDMVNVNSVNYEVDLENQRQDLYPYFLEKIPSLSVAETEITYTKTFADSKLIKESVMDTLHTSSVENSINEQSIRLSNRESFDNQQDYYTLDDLSTDTVVDISPSQTVYTSLSSRSDSQSVIEKVESCEQYRSIATKHFKPSDVDRALRVMAAESLCNTKAASPTNDHGLMQVNYPSWGHLVEWNKERLYDPEENIKIGAYILYNTEQGWDNWTVVTQGVVR